MFTPVVFIHGLWLAASSWQPWLDLFAERGYEPMAPTWPGEPDTVEAARADAQSGAGHGIDDVTGHYRSLIGNLSQPPILIGHSFGGLVVERLLGERVGRAGVAIDAASVHGTLPWSLSSLRSTLPAFKNYANEKRAVELTADQFRSSFGRSLDADESDDLWARWCIPSPARPLFEAAGAHVGWRSAARVGARVTPRGPLLLVLAGQDAPPPGAVGPVPLEQYRGSAAVTELVEFPDRGHSLTIDGGWREVADSVVSWLDVRVGS
jgi:pimeloyl-ACP methyl ester carboxylesterase